MATTESAERDYGELAVHLYVQEGTGNGSLIMIVLEDTDDDISFFEQLLSGSIFTNLASSLHELNDRINRMNCSASESAALPPLEELDVPEQLHDADGTQCVVCLRSDVATQEKMCVVPCGHAHFCGNCLRRALEHVRRCPTCRCVTDGIARLPQRKRCKRVD